MKKSVIVLVSMLFALGMVGSAYAIHADIPAETQAVVAKGATQVSLSGEIRVRGEYRKNVNTFNDDVADRYSAYDQRVTLGVNAKVTPNTEGQITVRAASNTNTDTYNWGLPPQGYNAAATNANSGGRGLYPLGENRVGGLSILEAWILHTGSGLIGVPAGVKVGHMPLKLGNGMFFDHTLMGDDALVFFADPIKELHIGLLTAKLNEGATASPDDSDAYVGLFVWKAAKDTVISGDITYVDDKTFGYLSNSSVAFAHGGTHLWNFGLRGNTKVSGFGLKADIELQTGKSKAVNGTATNTPGSNAGGVDIKNRGYAFMLGVDYTLAPVKISLDYAYGSGDKDGTDTKNGTFITALGQTQHFTYVYDYRALTAAADMGVANPGTGTGLANTNYWRLGLSTDFTKDLSGELSAYLLRASKQNFITVNGVQTTGKKSIGTEIDAKIAYKIDRNLTYWVEGGYLFAGSFYDTAAHNADNAYAVRHGIQLNF